MEDQEHTEDSQEYLLDYWYGPEFIPQDCIEELTGDGRR